MKKLAFILLLSSCSLWAQTQISGSAVQIGGNTGTGGTGTPNYYAMWCTNSTTLCNGHFDDGVTTTGTITSSEPLADTSATAAHPAGIDTNSATSVGPIFSRIFLCPNTTSTTPGTPWSAGCVLNLGSGNISTGPSTDGAQVSIQWNNYGSSSANRGSLSMSTSTPRAQALQWDLAGDIWFPNLTSFPCIGTDANGKIVSTSCGGGLSGMTAGQVPIAATATTVTSSKALAGSGAGIATGPTTTTAGDCVSYGDAVGTMTDAGAPCGSGGGGGLSGQTTNYLPLATSATASTTSSIVSQNGTTSVTVNTTGTAYGYDVPEGTALTPTAGHEILNSNSTTHTMDLSSNGGAFSPICTASNGECSAPATFPAFMGYTYVADSTAASVTTPAMSVTAGELLVVSCRFGTGTACTVTDSAGNTYTPLTARTNSGASLQISWVIAASTASVTFTATQSASVAGLSVVAAHYSGVGSVADANTGGTTLATPTFATTQRTLMVYCAEVQALTSWAITNVGEWSAGGVSQSAINASNADQGCAWLVTNGATFSGANPFSPASTNSPASSVLAFRW